MACFRFYSKPPCKLKAKNLLLELVVHPAFVQFLSAKFLRPCTQNLHEIRVNSIHWQRRITSMCHRFARKTDLPKKRLLCIWERTKEQTNRQKRYTKRKAVPYFRRYLKESHEAQLTITN
jgi:hypothetical protein